MLIVPYTDASCEQVFSLTAIWAHPCQVHLHTLEQVACKLLLLADDGPDWPYAFMWMNNNVSYAPLSSEGHVGAMTDGAPSTNACSQLHQLQVWKLLQHRSWVVCPEGLNRELEAVQFTFEELPLWNASTRDEHAWDPPLIEFNLISVHPDSMTTTIQDPTTTLALPPSPAATVDPPCDITMAINQPL